MHELSLCESLLQVLEQQALADGFTRVKTVWLRIGCLASVEPAAMRFGFAAITRGSLAEGARLAIIPVPAQAWCPGCGQAVTVHRRFDACPLCESELLPPHGGDELRISELEVE